MKNFYPVRHSDELSRILSLPRRRWADGQAAALTETWTPGLLNADGLREWKRVANLPHAHREAELKRLKIRLKPIQVMMLSESWQYRGLHAIASVGAGKTLFTWLVSIGMPMVDGSLGAKNPVLLVPVNLLDKTQKEFREIAKYWRAPNPPPRLITYTDLGQDSLKDLLKNIRPDLIILDESDELRNPKSVKSKHVHRFMKEFPDTPVISVSGTDLRKTIRDFSRPMIYALKFQAPVPIPWHIMAEWCEAIDDKPRDGLRRPVGALKAFADPNDWAKAKGNADKELAAVCDGYARWLEETPGIIVWDEQSCDEPLTVRVIKAPDDPVLDAAFYRFRTTHSTPDDWDLSDPLSVLKHGTELSCGFYYMWDPRPPKEWMAARKAWMKFAAETIRESQNCRRPIDTEARVAKAYPDAYQWKDWKEIRPTFTPNVVPVPLTASVSGYVAQWVQREGPGLIWVQHTYVGEQLSKMLKLPYFGRDGRTAKKSSHAWQGKINDYPPGRSAILSAHSNRRGRNLQSLNKNLIVGPEHSGERWEQMLGRTHRQGQERHVYADVLISGRENLRALDAACAEARRVKQKRRVEQKLLIAEWDWSQYPAVYLENLPIDHPSRSRW